MPSSLNLSKHTADCNLRRDDHQRLEGCNCGLDNEDYKAGYVAGWNDCGRQFAPSEKRECPNCKGSGETTATTQQHGPDDYEVTIACPECKGTGAVSPDIGQK